MEEKSVFETISKIDALRKILEVLPMDKSLVAYANDFRTATIYKLTELVKQL